MSRRDEYYVSVEAVSTAIAQRSIFNLIHNSSVVKVDFIVLKDTPFSHVEFARRQTISMADFQTTIITREDLILSKLLWARDSQSELQLRDVRNLVTPVCDMDYLRGWAGRLGISDLLEDQLRHE